MKTKYIFLYCLLFICNAVTAQKVITGAEQMDRLLPILKGKRVALVVNQTSKVGVSGFSWLVSFLLSV